MKTDTNEGIDPVITNVNGKIDCIIFMKIYLERNFQLVHALFVKRISKQSMPGDTCDSTCTCPYMWKTPSTSEKLPVPTSLSTVQFHLPNTTIIVVTAPLVTIRFCFHNFPLPCFILSETSSVLQQLENLYFRYVNLGSHFLKSNPSCRQRARAN